MARSSPPAPCPVPLERLAEAVHDASAPLGSSMVVSIDLGDHDVAFGTWVVPPGLDHPADPLVGFLAPASWDAIGLVCSGRLVPQEGERERPRVVLTVVADRTGGFTSVLTRDGADREVLHEAPEGWVADVLARTLGRPTPPPTVRLSRLVEAHWLDAVAGLVLHQTGTAPTWPRLARLHPLAGRGPAVPGPVLAERSEALDLESSWARMRRFSADRSVPSAPPRPPGGRDVPLHRWFDDGSFSRWSQRRLPPPEPLLAAVLAALPAELGAELVDALVSVVPPPDAP